jgi:integrase
MPKKRNATWSKVVEAHGVQVRIFERSRGSVLYRSVVMGGEKDRKSLGHRDRALAEQQARAVAKALAELQLTGRVAEADGGLGLAQLRRLYLNECAELLTPYRQGEVKKAFGLLERHVGEGFRVMDLGPHQVETYVAARQAGTLRPADTLPDGTRRARNIAKKAKAGTIAKELGCVHAALNWAATFRQGGRPLIPNNPLRGVSLPSEANPSRPVATRDRFDRLLEHADAIDGSGRFRMMLNVAWFTGRRLGAIANLRASDVLLNADQVRRALAEAGMDEGLADVWPAALNWSAESDKEGVNWIVPVPAVLRDQLAEYVRTNALLGGALLFPAERDPSRPVPKETAHYWIHRAEELAGLPRQTRGGWHTLRRAWATARKHMPLQDVMAAGGWRDATSLQRAYQQADPATVRMVMEAGS